VPPKGQRLHGVFLMGLAVVTVALLDRMGLLHWRFEPKPWPERWHDAPTITESRFLS